MTDKRLIDANALYEDVSRMGLTRRMGAHSDACGLVAYMKELRQLIEKHEDVVMLADANTMQFVPAKVYSYEETFKRMQEGRDIFC